MAPVTTINTKDSTANPQPGLVPVPKTSSPYDKFNLALMGILKEAQGAGSTAPLYAAKDEMQNEALNLSNPLADTPYAPLFKGMGYASTAAEEGTKQAFNPGITSITSQIQASNDATNKFNELANTAETIAQNSKNYVSPGQTLVDNAGNIIYQGHNYGATQINPNTNQLDNLDPSTGQWLSDVKKAEQNRSSGPTPPGVNVIVGGIDFSGKSTGVGVYATKPDYSKDIQGIYNSLENYMPSPNAPALDLYIKNNAPKSSVTGNMIMTAAQTYGIDPHVLAAVLLDESDFGTAGVGATTFNPGNVGNTDGGGTRMFSSWQQGVNAAANELARRMPGNVHATSSLKGGAQTPTSTATSDPKGNLYSQEYQNRVSQLPASVQKYTLAGPAGVAYIDGDTANAAGLGQVVALSAPKAGIPILSGSGISIMNNLNMLIQKMKSAQQLIDKNLTSSDSSITGHILNTIGATTNKISQNKPALAEFNTYLGGVTAAANTLKTLAGGAGSGLRITGYELGSVADSLPTQNDSWQTAKAKLDGINRQIVETLHTDFPDVNLNQIVSPQSQTSVSSGNVVSGKTPSGVSYTIH